MLKESAPSFVYGIYENSVPSASPKWLPTWYIFGCTIDFGQCFVCFECDVTRDLREYRVRDTVMYKANKVWVATCVNQHSTRKTTKTSIRCDVCSIHVLLCHLSNAKYTTWSECINTSVALIEPVFFHSVFFSIFMLFDQVIHMDYYCC